MNRVLVSVLRSLAVVGMAALLTGCGGNWGTVEGVVKLDQQTLDQGQVTFHPVGEGPIGIGTVGPNGAYLIKTGDRPGVKAGDYVVTVAKTTIPEMGSGIPVKFLTPQKYADKALSDLKVTVKAGHNSIPLDLKSK